MLSEFPEMAIRINDDSFTCFDLMKCMFKLSETELSIIKEMDETESLTAMDMGERIKRDRATAYRALEKLVSIGLVYKERRGREGRGYSNYYEKALRKDILRKAEKRLDHCYTAIKSALMNAE